VARLDSRVNAFLSFRLVEAANTSGSLEKVMDELGRRTRERGLTLEKLEETLACDAERR
jgi:hypothetical protein